MMIIPGVKNVNDQKANSNLCEEDDQNFPDIIHLEDPILETHNVCIINKYGMSR